MKLRKNFWIGIDQSINTLVKLCDGYGQPDEMLSARAWRLRNEHPKLQLWIDRLFFWDQDHCRECYEIEQQHLQMPEEYR